MREITLKEYSRGHKTTKKILLCLTNLFIRYDYYELKGKANTLLQILTKAKTDYDIEYKFVLLDEQTHLLYLISYALCVGLHDDKTINTKIKIKKRFVKDFIQDIVLHTIEN